MIDNTAGVFTAEQAADNIIAEMERGETAIGYARDGGGCHCLSRDQLIRIIEGHKFFELIEVPARPPMDEDTNRIMQGIIDHMEQHNPWIELFQT